MFWDTAFLPKGDFPEIESVTKGDKAAPASGSAGQLSTIQQQPTRIGVDVATDADVTIGDMERRNGLYILGRPRMGKSWLIVNIILQDVKKGYGVFSLDPHGDAIQDIRHRLPNSDKIVIFNPKDEEFSFGINLLDCLDIRSLEHRNATFARAKGVFDKLWKNTFEERPWLQLILQNTIHAFIENPGFTIAEFPMFFNDSAFRNYIVSNMQYNQQVKGYWLKTFSSKSKQDQDAQLEAAQTRVEILVGHPYVAHILGQSKTMIDFREIMYDKKLCLLNFQQAFPMSQKISLEQFL